MKSSYFSINWFLDDNKCSSSKLNKNKNSYVYYNIVIINIVLTISRAFFNKTRTVTCDLFWGFLLLLRLHFYRLSRHRRPGPKIPTLSNPRSNATTTTQTAERRDCNKRRVRARWRTHRNDNYITDASDGISLETETGTDVMTIFRGPRSRCWT